MDTMTVGLIAASGMFLFLYLRRRRGRLERESD